MAVMNAKETRREDVVSSGVIMLPLQDGQTPKKRVDEMNIYYTSILQRVPEDRFICNMP